MDTGPEYTLRMIILRGFLAPSAPLMIISYYHNWASSYGQEGPFNKLGKLQIGHSASKNMKFVFLQHQRTYWDIDIQQGKLCKPLSVNSTPGLA